jgi:hypothetical protein
MIYQYKARLQHDAGRVTIYTTATSEEQARASIQSAERCPPRAILSVQLVKPYRCNRHRFSTAEDAIQYEARLRAKTGIFYAVERV